MRSTGSLNTRKVESGSGSAWSDGLSGQSDWAQRPAPKRRWPAAFRRSRLNAAFSLPARSGLFLLITLLLIGLCAVLAGGGATHRLKRSENDLLADASSPKLNNISAEASEASPEPAPAEPEHLKLGAKDFPSPVLAPPFQAPEENLPASKTVLPASTLVSPDSAPSLESPAVSEAWEPGYRNLIRDPHQGVDPMLTNWKMLGLNTLFAGALFVSNSPAAEPPDLSGIPKQLEEIKKQLEDYKAPLSDIAKIKASMFAWEKTIEDLKEAGKASELRAFKVQGEVEELQRTITKMQKDLETLKNRPVSTQSSYPATAPAAPSVGRIRVLNTYFDPMTVVVNGTAHRVLPGETRSLDAVPAGTFTYEVLGVQPPQTRTLASNETFVVTVFPR